MLLFYLSGASKIIKSGLVLASSKKPNFFFEIFDL
jgi:hypothetical protein